MRKHGFGDLYIEEAVSVMQHRLDNAMTQFARCNAAHRSARRGTRYEQEIANDCVNWSKQIEILERMIELRLEQDQREVA